MLMTVRKVTLANCKTCNALRDEKRLYNRTWCRACVAKGLVGVRCHSCNTIKSASVHRRGESDSGYLHIDPYCNDCKNPRNPGDGEFY